MRASFLGLPAFVLLAACGGAHSSAPSNPATPPRSAASLAPAVAGSPSSPAPTASAPPSAPTSASAAPDLGPAQRAGAIAWQKDFGTLGDVGLVADRRGGFVAFPRFRVGVGHGYEMLALDATGAIRARTKVASLGFESAAADGRGGAWLVPVSERKGAKTPGFDRHTVIHVDASLRTVGSYAPGSSTLDLSSAGVDAAGRLVLAGAVVDESTVGAFALAPFRSGAPSTFLASFDSQLNPQWAKPVADGEDVTASVGATGAIAVLAHPGFQKDATLHLLGADGGEKWTRRLQECARAALLDASGSALVWGCGAPSKDSRVVLTRLGADGALLWSRAVPGADVETSIVALAPDGAAIVAYETADGAAPVVALDEIDPAGTHVWSARVPMPDAASENGADLDALAVDGANALLAIAPVGERVGSFMNADQTAIVRAGPTPRLVAVRRR